MGTGNGDAVIVLFHEGTQSLGPGDRRDPQFSGPGDLRIIIADSYCVYDQVNVLHVLRTVTQKDLRTIIHQLFGEGVILTVRPMGGDVLYEVVFETAGTKKLMGTYAKLKKK
jgi:hypothetical protein